MIYKYHLNNWTFFFPLVSYKSLCICIWSLLTSNRVLLTTYWLLNLLNYSSYFSLCISNLCFTVPSVKPIKLNFRKKKKEKALTSICHSSWYTWWPLYPTPFTKLIAQLYSIVSINITVPFNMKPSPNCQRKKEAKTLDRTVLVSQQLKNLEFLLPSLV